MSKRTRQYIGILAALVSYYVIHEGAHLIYAYAIGVFEGIRFMGLGVQIVTDSQRMTNTQLGIFCTMGFIATIIAGYILAFDQCRHILEIASSKIQKGICRSIFS